VTACRTLTWFLFAQPVTEHSSIRQAWTRADIRAQNQRNVAAIVVAQTMMRQYQAWHIRAALGVGRFTCEPKSQLAANVWSNFDHYNNTHTTIDTRIKDRARPQNMSQQCGSNYTKDKSLPERNTYNNICEPCIQKAAGRARAIE
jgi:type II secretory pathway pseudopilin PulG